MTTLAPLAQIATADDWTRFMHPIVAAVRNPPSETEFRARIAAIVHAISVPAEWLRQPWRQTDAMRRFPFWPSVADLAELFADDLKAARETADRTARLSPPAPDEAPRMRTMEEILAVKAAAAAVAAHARASAAHGALAAAADEARAKPILLSDGALLEAYDHAARKGNRAAAFRAETLRARIKAASHG